MAPRRLPQTRAEAERQLREAAAVLAALDEKQEWTTRAQKTEPLRSGTVVRFEHRFVRNGQLYTYAAVRADNSRGLRRWFITGADYLPVKGHQGIASPATWAELVAFAERGSIQVAERWRNLPAILDVSASDAPHVNPEILKAFFGTTDDPDFDDDERRAEIHPSDIY